MVVMKMLLVVVVWLLLLLLQRHPSDKIGEGKQDTKLALSVDLGVLGIQGDRHPPGLLGVNLPGGSCRRETNQEDWGVAGLIEIPHKFELTNRLAKRLGVFNAKDDHKRLTELEEHVLVAERVCQDLQVPHHPVGLD